MLYGGAFRASAEKATVARREADVLACKAWNDWMLGYKGPAQPSPTLGDALNAGLGYLDVRRIGCDTHQTVALHIIRRPKATPVHELERYLRCKDCSQLRGYPYKRNHLVALRQIKSARCIRWPFGGVAIGDAAGGESLYRVALNWRSRCRMFQRSRSETPSPMLRTLI